MNTIDNYDFRGKRAIIRVDFNVPLDDQGNVTDETRIRAAIPTILKVLDGGGAVILMSHLGRPKKNNDEKYSLRHIIPTIERLLGRPVIFAGDSMGEKAAEMLLEKIASADSNRARYCCSKICVSMPRRRASRAVWPTMPPMNRRPKPRRRSRRARRSS